MNFYLDFEAMRFSNRIISIGCVAENGATFKTLVQHGTKKKVDKFITELTGITNEMLADAPTADAAFRALYEFICLNSDNTTPSYYTYGNSDIDFINATLKSMRDPVACICAQALAGNIIDYAQVVKKYFVSSNEIALRKVYMLIQNQNELIQNHDALEDARMLETVVSQLHNKCKPEDKNTILAIPSQPRPANSPQRKKAPEIYQRWNASAKWEAETNADENNWMLKCVDQHSGETKYFNDFTTAALWVIKYIARNVSPKNEGNVNRIINNLKSAPQTGKCRYNCHWFYSAEGAIAATAKEESND
jgi:DNA polymerase III epsilon subunit-like protein